MTLPVGAMLGRYRIEAEVGRGLGGVVYRAFDIAIERVVAVKCLLPPPPKTGPGGTHIPRDIHFEEAKMIGQLNHPHIAAIFDTSNADGVLYIVMEFVEGETLKARINKQHADPPSLPQALRFLVMVARALHYVHQRGILHGDIKPSNLIVTPDGTPKIMDFGVARRARKRRSGAWRIETEEEVWGTLGYLAPEQFISQEIDARADVFSLGVIAYEWLAGHKPFAGKDAEALQAAMLNVRPKPLTEAGEFPPQLSAAVDQALAPEPYKRFESADAFADVLEICLEQWHKEQPQSHPQDRAEAPAPIAFPRLKKGNLLFAGFTESDLSDVMRLSRRETYQTGDVIVRQGSGGSTMYVIISGCASVQKSSRFKHVEIKRVSAGECFGEMAVISQMPRSASVVALQQTEVVAISGALLRSANEGLSMKLYRNIASLLADRLRHNDDQMVDLLSAEDKPHHKRLFAFW